MAKKSRDTRDQLLQENAELRARLGEAEETLRAIHNGEVDAVVVSGPKGDRVYSLVGAESIYRLVVETMKEAALTVAPNGTILYCNTRFGELIKRPLEQIVGRPLTAFLGLDGPDSAEPLAALREGSPEKRRVVFAGSDGTKAPALVSSSLLNQPEGVSVCLVATDLTELEQSAETLHRLRRQQEALEKSNAELAAAEEALRAEHDRVLVSERRLRAFFDTAAVGTFEMDLNGRLVRVNDRYCHLTGHTREELMGMASVDLIHPDDRATEQPKLASYLEGRSPEYDGEMRFVRRDGSIVWMHVSEAMVRDAAGEPLHSAGVVRDVTGRRQLIEEIRRVNESLEQRVTARTAQLRSANLTLRMISQCNEVLVRASDELELARDICAIIQAGGYRMVWVGYALNDAGRTVRPVASAGFEGGYLERLRFSWADNELGRGPTGTCIRTGLVRVCDDFFEDPQLRPWRDEAVTRGYRSSISLPLRLAGRVLGAITLYAAAPGYFDQGQIALLSELADDLALGIGMLRSRAERDHARLVAEERARQLRALATRLVQAEHGERRRIARVLHDNLQQLLVGAKFHLAIAETDMTEPAASRPLRQAQKILDDAIRAARSLTTELSPPVLHEKGLGAGLEWLRRQLLETHGLKVRLSVTGDAEPASELVRLFLFDAARELLFNVIKHAGVRQADVELVREATGRLSMSVSDEGVGFDAGGIERGAAAHGSFGLFSIRERIDHLGGSMTVDSAPGRGSRFVVVVPDGVTAAEGESSPTVEPGVAAQDILPARADAAGPVVRGKIRVLLADDHPTMREGLARLLGDRQDIAVVGEAEDGVSAVEMARDLCPDVILMDVSMPRMDGIEATELIGKELPRIRVIGLSMYEAADQAEAMREAGAVAYLSKTVSPAALVAAIRRAVAAGPQPNGAAPARRSKRAAKRGSPARHGGERRRDT